MYTHEIFIPNARIEFNALTRKPVSILDLDNIAKPPIIITDNMEVQISEDCNVHGLMNTHKVIIRIKDDPSVFDKLLKRIPESSNRTFCVLPGIKDVVFNCPATIVFWEDGTKTVVKCMEGDIFNPEHGFAMAVLKKLYGTEDKPNEYRKLVKRWVNHGVSKIPEQDMWKIGEEYHPKMTNYETETIFFKNVSDLARTGRGYEETVLGEIQKVEKETEAMLTKVERQILFNQKLIVRMLQCPEAIHSEIAQMAIKIAMDRTDALLMEDESDAESM